MKTRCILYEYANITRYIESTLFPALPFEPDARGRHGTQAPCPWPDHQDGIRLRLRVRYIMAVTASRTVAVVVISDDRGAAAEAVRAERTDRRLRRRGVRG